MTFPSDGRAEVRVEANFFAFVAGTILEPGEGLQLEALMVTKPKNISIGGTEDGDRGTLRIPHSMSD
jgi:hypothetical protein